MEKPKAVSRGKINVYMEEHHDLENEQGMIVLFNREDAHEITGGPNGIDVLGIQISPDFLLGWENGGLKKAAEAECSALRHKAGRIGHGTLGHGTL